MPLRYKILENGSLVYTRGDGIISHEDSVQHQKSLIEDPNVKAGYREVFDVRFCTAFKIDEQTIEEVIQVEESDPAKMRDVKCAVIANDQLLFKLQHLFESPEVETVIVFNELGTGAKWLNVTDLAEIEQAEF